MANGWLIASAVLVIGLGLFHSILGERYIVRRLLRRENLPKLFGADTFTKRTIRYAWHLLTILSFVVGGILAWAAGAPANEFPRVPIVIISAGLAVSGVWGIAATRGRHLSWIVFLAAAALAFIGADLGAAGT